MRRRRRGKKGQIGISGLVICIIILLVLLWLYWDRIPGVNPVPRPDQAGEPGAPPPAATGPYEVYFTTPVYPDRPATRRGGIDEKFVAYVDAATNADFAAREPRRFLLDSAAIAIPIDRGRDDEQCREHRDDQHAEDEQYPPHDRIVFS